jgi:hypothetical protein
VDGVLHPSFSEATNARGLLDDQGAAVATIADELASFLHTPVRARVLFLLVLQHFVCEPINLLDTFLDDLTEVDWAGAEAHTKVVADLHRGLVAQQSSVQITGLMCLPWMPNTPLTPLLMLMEYLTYPRCNQTSVQFFCWVIQHLSQAMPQTAEFVQVEGEPGGGKSFLLQTLLLHARSLGCSCLPAAFPAKVAQVARNFPCGQTAHFWLALSPSALGEDITLHAVAPSASPQSDTKQQAAGGRLRDARLIFIDKVTMMRAAELDAVVAKLDELGFGGVFMIVGNCAHLSAVLPSADEATILASAIVNAITFRRFQHFRLTGQMRMTDSDLREAC